MAHLLNIWPSVRARLSLADRILLLFDYDGTLTPIVNRPEDALLPDEARRRLTVLAAHPRCIAGIVSGRSLADLSALAGIPNLIHAGNHGMEIRFPSPVAGGLGRGEEFAHPGAIAARRILDRTQADLAAALAHVPGVIVEHKGLTLTVHYRSTPESLVGQVGERVTAIVQPYIESGQLRLTEGKMVVEVRPDIPWDKGKAIERIYLHSCEGRNPGAPPLPVYFGDDRTDEDGFRVVQEKGGLAVFVGEPRQGTVALHQLDSPAEVSEAMGLLLEEL